ncbi:MAG: porin family protein [Sulfurovum sp.]|nr:porin family protein [Sulfurovum sp.]
MKKLFLPILASMSLFAADHNLYNHSIGITGGYAVNSSETRLDNEFSWGLRYHYNRTTVEGSIDIDALQLTFDYSGDALYQNPAKSIVDGKTNIYRLGANAIWYIENDSDFTPYALLGLGVQFFEESAAKDNNNALTATVGAGVEYQLRGDFSVIAEAKGVFAGDGSSYLLVNVGAKYSFGQNY